MARCKLIEIITLVKMLIQLKCAQQQHLALLVTHKRLMGMLLLLLLQLPEQHLPTKRDIIATYCLAGVAPPTPEAPSFRLLLLQLKEHQQHVVRSAAAAAAPAATSPRNTNNSRPWPGQSWHAKMGAEFQRFYDLFFFVGLHPGSH